MCVETRPIRSSRRVNKVNKANERQVPLARCDVWPEKLIDLRTYQLIVILLLMALVAVMLTGCGGAASTEEPEEEVAAATEEPTPEPQPTDTPEPPTETPTPEPTDTPTPEPTDTPTPEPTDTPEPTPVPLEDYTHPSEAFSLSVPAEWEMESEEADNVLFGSPDEVGLIAGFGNESNELSLDPDEAIGLIMEGFPMDEAEIIADEERPDGSLYKAMLIESPTGDGEMQANFLLKPEEEVLFVLSLMTTDYDSVEPLWEEVMASFTVDSELALEAIAALEPPTPEPEATTETETSPAQPEEETSTTEEATETEPPADETTGTAATGTSGLDWQPFSPADGSFTLMMPGDPQVEELPTGGTNYQIQTPQGVMCNAAVVSFTEEEMGGVAPQEFLTLMGQITAASMGEEVEIVSEEAVTLNGQPGLAMELQNPADPSVAIRLRLYLLSNNFYILALVTDTDTVPLDEALQCVDTLEVAGQ